MAGNHLREPLDYLYEELPPERMAEVRQHLAECPECRAQLRVIRETVKLYRQAEHPIAPVGLSARTIKNALEIARAHERSRSDQTDKAEQTGKAKQADKKDPSPPPAPAPTPKPIPAAAVPAAAAAFVSEPVPAAPQTDRESRNESEFARLKEEVMGEIHRGGWRSWLFHPAWTVAASVIFLCALLIHFSPRMHSQPEPVRGFVAPQREDSPSPLRERERLPASRPLPESTETPTPEAPPILQEAAALNEPLEIIRSVAPRPPSAAPALRRTEAFLTAPSPTAPVQNERTTASKRLPMPAAAFAIPEGHSMPALEDAAEEQKEKADEAAEAKAEEKIGPSPESRTMAKAKVFSTPDFPETRAVRDADADDVPEEKPEVEDVSPAARPKRTAPVVVLDGFSPDEVPEIVERPAPMDVRERVQSLTTLIGMQIASGEFADARQAIAILERYDANAAETLRALMRSVPAQATEKAVIGQTLPDDAPEPRDKEVPPVTPTESLQPLRIQVEPTPEPIAAPEPLRPSPGAFMNPENAGEHFDRSPLGWIEPPEDPPMSKVRVPSPEAEPVFSPPGVPAGTERKVRPPPAENPSEAANPEARNAPGDTTEIVTQAAALEPPPVPYDIPYEVPYEYVEDPGRNREPEIFADIFDEPAVPVGTAHVVQTEDARAVFPQTMEPAASPEGFVQVKTGPARTTWVAVGTASAPVESVVVPVPAAEPEQSIPAAPSMVYAIPAPVPVVPTVVYQYAPRTVVATPVPAPRYRPTPAPVRRGGEPKPYMRDY